MAIIAILGQRRNRHGHAQCHHHGHCRRRRRLGYPSRGKPARFGRRLGVAARVCAIFAATLHDWVARMGVRTLRAQLIALAHNGRREFARGCVSVQVSEQEQAQLAHSVGRTPPL